MAYLRVYTLRLVLPQDEVDALVGKGWSLGEASQRLEIIAGDLLAEKFKEKGK